MGKTFSGLILKTSYDKMGDTSTITALGKTFLDWVKLALVDAAFVAEADYYGSTDFPAVVKPYLRRDCDYVVVLFSDTPLITGKTVAAAVEEAYAGNKAVLRMTRGYVFDCDYLRKADKIYTENTFYFDEEDFITAFSFKQVGLISDILKNRILDYHMEQGVHFTDLIGTTVGCDVRIEPGVTVGRGNVIMGKTRIRRGAVIGDGNTIDDCVIDENASVECSHMSRSYIGKRTSVGPYAHLKGDVVLGDDCKVGSFTELKACRVGADSKIAHLAYVGDAVIGKRVNVGAGAVFANFDGREKHTTTVGDGAFIGSSSTLIAPVNIGAGAFVAAGSVINASVPGSALAIARARMEVKENWAAERFNGGSEPSAPSANNAASPATPAAEAPSFAAPNNTAGNSSAPAAPAANNAATGFTAPATPAAGSLQGIINGEEVGRRAIINGETIGNKG